MMVDQTMKAYWMQVGRPVEAPPYALATSSLDSLHMQDRSRISQLHGLPRSEGLPGLQRALVTLDHVP